MAPLQLSTMLAVLAFVISLAFAAPPSSPNAPPPPAVSVWPHLTFQTEPDFKPPQFSITKTGDTSPGLILFASAGVYGEGGAEDAAMIMTEEGDLVWQAPQLNNETLSTLNIQILRGRPVLTYWSGIFDNAVGLGYGRVLILDDTYTVLHEITLTDNIVSLVQDSGSHLDAQESRLTPGGTIFVTAYNLTQTDLTTFGGPSDGWVYDSLFYEIDVATNSILFRWRALDHLDEIPLKSSQLPFTNGTGANKFVAWDWFHINSIEPAHDGYLISARNLFTPFYLWNNGTVKWALQGQTGGDFKLESGPTFKWQHDVRILEENTNGTMQITMHNNNNNGFIDNGTEVTTGLVLQVDQTSVQVSLQRNLSDPNDPIYSNAGGSFDFLATGYVFLGHGIIPKMKEYDASGKCIYTAQFGLDNEVTSYRAHRGVWQGVQPIYPISVKVCEGDDNSGTKALYVSWNGATAVNQWEIYWKTGDTIISSQTVNRTGFETMAVVPNAESYQVAALQRYEDAVLGTSDWVEPVAC